MVKKPGKRGLTYTDWIISFIVFLLYITWFFFLISPRLVIPQTNALETTADSVKESIENEISWGIKELPLSVEASQDEKKAGVIISLNQTRAEKWGKNKSRLVMEKNIVQRIELINGKLLFQEDLKEGNNYLSLLNSEKGYNDEENELGLIGEEGRAETTGMRIDYEEGVPEKVVYKGEKRVSSIKYLVNGEKWAPKTSWHNKSFFVVAHLAKADEMKEECYVFANKTRVNCWLEGNEDVSKTRKLEIIFSGYDQYYLTSAEQGEIENKSCWRGNTSLIGLYDNTSQEGAVIKLVGTEELNLCGWPANLSLEFNFLEGEWAYEIIFFQGAKRKIEEFKGKTKIRNGAVIEHQGWSEEKIRALENRSYGELKEAVGLKSRDFSVKIKNSGEIIEINKPETREEIYSKRYPGLVLGENKTKETGEMIISVW